MIAPGSKVTLHFSLALDSGELIDSNFDHAPASFTVGDGSMLPGFEAVLMGKAPEECVQETLPAEQAFGALNEANVHRFSKSKFLSMLQDDMIPTEVGTVISFKDAGGFDLPGVIREIAEHQITVDFNHPLAGKAIVFKAKIIAVLPPELSAVEIRL